MFCLDVFLIFEIYQHIKDWELLPHERHPNPGLCNIREENLHLACGNVLLICVACLCLK